MYLHVRNFSLTLFIQTLVKRFKTKPTRFEVSPFEKSWFLISLLIEMIHGKENLNSGMLAAFEGRTGFAVESTPDRKRISLEVLSNS